MRRSIGAARRALFAALCVAATNAAATTVFVNELHYDNVSTDANEGVEIAGPAGFDLTGWKIHPYNGNGGVTYGTAATLSGTIPANCGGYGVVSVPIAGLQNGSPDGLALVDAGGQVVQFLSYEGVFVATTGPANGMTSVDIGVSEAENATPATSSLRLTGNGTQYADFVWQGVAPASMGACNAGQTFGAPPDIAPTVASTVPADAATGVALAATLSIAFSEPVDTAPDWFDIQCSASGSHTATASGSGNARTLDPDVDFAIGETCTVTVAADRVTDLDGAPDAMTQDYAFAFATIPGDVPPAVASTSPTPNAIGFPRAANLQVTFTESVTLDADWFTLTCATSGTHAATVSGSGANYTLDPAADFAAIEHCVFTIRADRVHDVDGTIHAMAADVVVGFDTAADTNDYYAGADTSSGPALAAWLHGRIRNHTAYPYSGGAVNTWTILRAADEDPANPANVVDVYKNQTYAKTSASLNREHTWPNSYGFNDVESLGGQPYAPFTDCHMLYMADASYNQSRGNRPFGTCAGTGTCAERPTQAYGGFGGAGHSNWRSSLRWEVWDHRRGDVARAILYMDTRYDGGTAASGQPEPQLIVTDDEALIHTTASGVAATIAYMGMKSDLVAWHEADPPDELERLRNEVVYSYQHNRNPYIDHPEWVRCVFTNTQCPVVNDAIFANGFESP
jgi:endonuclease I